MIDRYTENCSHGNRRVSRRDCRSDIPVVSEVFAQNTPQRPTPVVITEVADVVIKGVERCAPGPKCSWDVLNVNTEYAKAAAVPVRMVRVGDSAG